MKSIIPKIQTCKIKRIKQKRLKEPYRKGRKARQRYLLDNQAALTAFIIAHLNQYFDIINYLEYLIEGPIQNIRYGNAFETYLYNVMEYLCKDDTFAVMCYIMMAFTFISSVLVWLMSFLAMVSGKRFDTSNSRIICTTRENQFRGGINKFETANLTYFGGLLVERKKK